MNSTTSSTSTYPLQQQQQQPQPQQFQQSQLQPQQLPSIYLSQQPIQQDNFQFDYSQINNNNNNNYQSQRTTSTTTNYSNLLVPNYHYNATPTSASSSFSSTTSSNLNSNSPKLPISPVSLPEKDQNSFTTTTTNYPVYYQQQQIQQQQLPQHPIQQTYYALPHLSTNNIDYSSLVSYTISPSLKRKRRTSKKLTSSSISPLAPSSTDTESYPCTVCSKVFQKPYNLKSHMKTHSSEKPFSCQFCPKTFARSHDKKRHELLHQGVKNFKCEGYLKDGVTKWGCGKKFARSDALSRHFRTETGWLCIRPLMDEANRLEMESNSNNL
ncbi:CRZ2 Transcriptional regulator CRZ2 [Candida maltosa Xu316]